MLERTRVSKPRRSLCALPSSDVILVDTPAFICVKQPRQHQCTEDSGDAIYPIGYRGAEKPQEECLLAARATALSMTADHARRCAEIRKSETHPERGYFVSGHRPCSGEE